jgi:uncharacterized membrane protein YtjA (UPF0391 family)
VPIHWGIGTCSLLKIQLQLFTLRNRDSSGFGVFADPSIIVPVNTTQLGGNMLYWTLIFLVIALIAGVLGFTGVAVAAAGVAKLLFFVFLVLFVISLVTHMTRRGRV